MTATMKQPVTTPSAMDCVMACPVRSMMEKQYAEHQTRIADLLAALRKIAAVQPRDPVLSAIASAAIAKAEA